MENHISYLCHEVIQGDRTRIYLGVLPFKSLRMLFTVSPREPRTDDPYFADTPNPSARYPQRPEKPERMKEIADFVAKRLDSEAESRKEVIFPGTVILGLLTDVEEHEKLPEHPTPTAAHILPHKCGKEIYLSNTAKSLFVIDGQHRIKGLNALYERLETQCVNLKNAATSKPEAEEIVKQLKKAEASFKQVQDFQMPISLLIDFDLEEQAMVFAAVNFNQKPVSRSFYFDIFGAFESDKVSPLSFTHELVVHLQNAEKSPLRGMIKLLGTGPGIISQAFLVERLVQLIDPQHPKSVFRTYFLLRMNGDVAGSRHFASIVRNYFSAVRAEFPYAWPAPKADGKYSSYTYHFILCKSMVASGLLGVLREIYKLIILDFGYGKETALAEKDVLAIVFFQQFLAEIDPAGRKNPSESIFSRNSPWAIGGSGKLERIIFESLRSNVFETYKKFALDPKSTYRLTCTEFKGAGRAITLLTDYPNPSAFWIKTEEQWEALSK